MPHRRTHDKTTTSEPHTGFQGEGGFGRRQGREDAGRVGTAVRHSPQPDHPVEGAASRRGSRIVWLGESQRQQGASGGSDGAACQDRRADTGERFFGRRARQGGFAERKAMIDRSHDLPITKQAKVLNVSRGSVYYLPRAPSSADLALMRRMDELHLDFPFAGSRMLRDLLTAEGFRTGRRHVATLMKRIGIQAVYRKPNTSKPAPGHKIYPYLLRDLAVTRPNQVWAMDLTYVPMARGFVYLAAVIDWFSRRVLSWRLSITMEFCVEAVEDALARHGKPEIFNTDQGSQFTSMAFTGLL